jgi:hypothetical protein
MNDEPKGPVALSSFFLFLKRPIDPGKENNMASTRHRIDRPSRIPSFIPLGKREWQRAVRRRFDGVAVGCWLGGFVLGTVGCLLGASLSYHHPVARVIGVVWWGIYLGCLGACIGALGGLFARRVPAPPSQESAPAERPLSEKDIDWPTGAAEPTEDPFATAMSERVG